jgi:hypothetical protein
VCIDGSGCARALPLEPHHLRLTPEKTIHGAHLLLLHLQRRVIPDDDVSAALMLIQFHDFALDFFTKGPCVDCAKEQEQEAILSHSHLVLTLIHHAINMDHHAGVVVCAVGIVGYREGVSCLDEEVGDCKRLGSKGGIIFYLFFPVSFLANGFCAAMGFTLGGMVAPSLLLVVSSSPSSLSSASSASSSALSSLLLMTSSSEIRMVEGTTG